jgi:ribonuclease HI
VVQIEEVDKTKPWDFFDGAAISDNQKSGGGALLMLSDTHFFTLKIGLGPGTNNFAELMAIKFLITFSIEKGVTSIQILEIPS